MIVVSSERLLRTAAILTLIALALMVWSILDPQPLLLVVAMSGGQALGSLALALDGWAILRDLKRAKVLDLRAKEKR